MKSQSKINIVKANGQRELFDSTKLETSLLRTEATSETVDKIIDHVKSEITDGMTTAQIYTHAFFLLHKLQIPAAHRYSLRRSVMNLGPSGFPFERYVGEILKARGFTVEVGQIVQGGCVPHEVDIVAWNENKLLMVEIKFHNDQVVKSDLKTALYIKARYDDLREVTHFYGSRRRKLDDFWIITNTKFTTTAIEYGMCKGITMIGWNFPEKGNLQDMIEDGDLIPITCLNEINKAELKLLLDQGIVLCKQIRGNVTLLMDAGLSRERAQKIADEAGRS